MLKRWAVMLLCLLTVVAFSACGSNKTSANTPSGSAAPASTSGDSKIPVSVTFNAMKELVEVVGQDKVEISTIIPDGTEPHDFEPKAQDLVALSTAKVFVYSGLGMETWAEQAVKAANNAKLITVEASKGADGIKNTEPGEIEEHGQFDPHIWLSIKVLNLK